MSAHAHYSKSARYYDAIYAATGKDYAREAERIHGLIQRYKRSPGSALLDVACGTAGTSNSCGGTTRWKVWMSTLTCLRSHD